MVLSWLLNSLHKSLTSTVVYATNAADVWHELKARFSRSNAPRLYQIQQQIINCKQGQSSISAYYTQIKGRWDEYDSLVTLPTCECGAMRKAHDIQEHDRLIQFLMRLNESYGAIRSQILLMDPVPNTSKAYALLVQEECQRDLHVPLQSDNISAAIVKKQNHDNNRFKSRTRPQCEHCGRLGHIKARCYLLHGFPKKSTSNGQRQQPQANLHSTNDALSIPPSTKSQEQSPPLTPELYHQFMEFINSKTPKVNLAAQSNPVKLSNGSTTPVTHVGPTLDEVDWEG
ncbi:uncharacterized protein LOC116263554 [Nymphaea colorata]|uniref:uncharacterized protein LOC116263554 n=1 Tax=Nymphaea colorata TaxID=210225 RepID=UPI00129D38A8|nr:uncharacterized protein LOC116263554 [Nymphaea colorata]